jgi:beta-lactamase regulating signal transducer with metallopeptidase domain
VRAWVYFPFVACAIGLLAARPVARRTEPQLAARLLALTGLLLALTTAAALSLLAFTVVARVPLIATHGHWAAAAVGRKVIVPLWVGALAIVCIAAIAANAVRMLNRYRRDVARAVRLQFASQSGIITVADSDVFAYACRAWPFRPGVVVVSHGLHETLAPDERAAVFAHEQSHLRHQHGLYELTGLITRALNPMLKPLTDAISFSLERWADEDAAAAHGRDVTASALAVSALHRTQPTPKPVLAHVTTDAPARVHALIEDAHQRNRAIAYAIAANAILATAAVVLAAHSTELIFEALRR